MKQEEGELFRQMATEMLFHKRMSPASVRGNLVAEGMDPGTAASLVAELQGKKNGAKGRQSRSKNKNAAYLEVFFGGIVLLVATILALSDMGYVSIGGFGLGIAMVVKGLLRFSRGK